MAVLQPPTFCCCPPKIELSLAGLSHRHDGKRMIDIFCILSFGAFAIDTGS